MIIFDFSFYLTLAVAITGLITLIDQLFFKKRRVGKKAPLWIVYARDFFPVLLIVWVVRSFVVQPYRVPSGSLEPTVLPGDFIAVKQFAYGIYFPVWNKKIIEVGEPKRGQIALFRFPKNPKMVFVKRVIGVPGDHIEYKDKVLYINGKKQDQKFLYNTVDPEAWGAPVEVREETLDGIKHQIYVRPYGGETADYDSVVTPGHYFMMGDNRDDSNDSRTWGFVPEENLIGQAFGIWMSWDKVNHTIRWHRIGKGL